MNEWVRDGRDPTIFWKFLGGTKELIGDRKGAKYAYEMALDGDPNDKDCWRSLESTLKILVIMLVLTRFVAEVKRGSVCIGILSQKVPSLTCLDPNNGLWFERLAL